MRFTGRRGFLALAGAAAARVVEDACRGIDNQGSLAKAWAAMKVAGVKRIQSTDLV